MAIVSVTVMAMREYEKPFWVDFALPVMMMVKMMVMAIVTECEN